MSTKDEKDWLRAILEGKVRAGGCRVGEDMEGGGFYRGEACAERGRDAEKRRAGGGSREDVAGR